MSAQSVLAAPKSTTKSNKFGASRFVFSDAVYTIRSDNVEYSAAEPLTGIVLFYEHIFGDFFSIGLHYGSNMSRNIEEAAAGTVVNIQELANYLAYDLKAFFSSHKSGGIKFYLGGGQGSLNISSNVSTRNSTGVSTEEDTNTSVPVTYGSIGVDAFSRRSSAGFRFEVGSVSAEKTETVSGTQAVYDFTGYTYSLAIFYRF